MPKLIIFDLDGTLTDPKVGITTAFAYALKKYGIEADPDSLTPVIGPPLKDSFMELYGFDEPQAVEAIREYRVYFADRGWAENAPYPGIAALLQKLQREGRQLLVATSKPELFTRQILEHFDLARYFTHICAAPMDESDGGRKENVIAAALRKAEVAKYCCIVVATVPAVVLYVFMQKYFVKGVMIGSLKG